MLPIVSLSPFAAGTDRVSQSTHRLTQLRTQLSDLNRQLATGKVSQTYGGLGLRRITALDAHAKSDAIDGYTSVIDQALTRIKISTAVTTQLSTIGSDVKETLIQAAPSPSDSTIANTQTLLRGKFDEALNLFNESADGLYLFSGRTRDVKPVVTADEIINGSAGQAGLKQLITERRQADLGAAGQGRLTVTQVGATVTLAEEAVGLPFGIKIPNAPTGAFGGVTVTTGGAPQSIAFNFTAIPADGDRLTLTVQLPSGEQASLNFVAGGSNASGDDIVVPLGGTAAATATNFNTALTSAVQNLAATKLGPASALRASQDFFAGSVNNPPVRVAGPPFTTATGYAAPGSRPTVIWYQGDDDTSIAARDTAKIQVDSDLKLAIGGRANEPAYTKFLAALGSIVADDFPPGNATTANKFVAALTQTATQLANPGGTDQILQIETAYGLAQKTAAAAKERHRATRTLVQSIISDVEDADVEDVSTAILSLKTRLEISYEATSIISQLNLVNFLR